MSLAVRWTGRRSAGGFFSEAGGGLEGGEFVEIAGFQGDEGAGLVLVVAGGIPGLEADGAVEAEFEAGRGDAEFDLGLGSAGEDADEGGLFFAGLVDFEVDGAGGSGLDAGAAVVEDAAEFRGSAGDCEVGLGVFEDVGVAALPSADLVLEAGAEGFRVERAAVEEDGIDGWEVAEEIGQISGDSAVGGVGEAPFLEGGIGLDGACVGGDFGVKAVEEDGGDFVAGDAGGEGAGEETGAAAGEGNGEFLGGVAVGGEAAFFQIAATGDEVLPLAAGERFAFAGETGF